VQKSIQTILKESQESADKKKAKLFKKKATETTENIATNLASTFEKTSLNEEQNPIGNFKIAVVDGPPEDVKKINSYKGQLQRACLREKQVDLFETDQRDIVPLLKFLNKDDVIYEPCAGNGAIVNFFKAKGFTVFSSDLYFGENRADFLNNDKHPVFDVLITNPPYKGKVDFLETAYKLGKKFILMLPLASVSSAGCGELLRKNGFALGILNTRPIFFHDGKRHSYGVGGCAWFFGGDWEFINKSESRTSFKSFFLDNKYPEKTSSKLLKSTNEVEVEVDKKEKWKELNDENEEDGDEDDDEDDGDEDDDEDDGDEDDDEEDGDEDNNDDDEQGEEKNVEELKEENYDYED
jgi:hypothetical protein